ncbi:MAG: C39 family peptidase, partial [Chloroflexi bacterium]|nr:C39 family peptidase [Chloroflexota bacterium]
MPKLLLPVTHFKQAQRADCIAACAKMVLDYIEKPINYDRLLRILRVNPDYGTVASNILRLKEVGVDVLYSRGSLEDIRSHLADNRPCIAFVNTDELPYWHERGGHAVVVIGIDDDLIYLNDPSFPESPQAVLHGNFLLA